MKNYKDWDFSEIQLGDLELDIFYNDNLISTIKPPLPHYEDKHRDSINEETESIDIDEYCIDINIQSSTAGIYVMVSSEDIDLNNLEIETNYTVSEMDVYNQEIENFKYAPVLSHTQTTPVVLSGVTEENIKNFIPYLYMEEYSRIENYIEEDYDFPHFLDLWYMHEVTNENERKSIKENNVERKEIGLKATKLPNKTFHRSSTAQVLNYYNELKNNYNIPVIEINNVIDFKKIKYFTDYKYLSFRIIFDVDKIDAIIDEYNNIKSDIESYEKFWLILDFNTLHHFDTLNHYVKRFVRITNNIELIYLGSPFKSSDISIPRDETNENKILYDPTINIYRKLTLLYNIPLWFGDFAGFERKTPSKGMGKPTARVVLRSYTKDNILVRRGWDDIDVQNGKFGYKNSMIKLLGDITVGAISKEYLNDEKCDVDYAILTHGANSISMGQLKTYCFRHNICNILKRFTDQ